MVTAGMKAPRSKVRIAGYQGGVTDPNKPPKEILLHNEALYQNDELS